MSQTKITDNTKTTLSMFNIDEEYKTFICFSLKVSAEIDKVGEITKKCMFPVGWQKFTTSKINLNKHNAIAIITGQKSNIFVIDYDKPDLFDRDILLFPELKNYYVKNRKGYHCYFKWSENIQNFLTSTSADGIDFQGDGKCVFAPPTHYQDINKNIYTYQIIHKNTIIEMSNDCMQYLKNTYLSEKKIYKIKSKKLDLSIINTNEIIENEINDLANIININYLDSYNSWCSILWSLRSININHLDIALHISKKSNKFDLTSFNKVWNSYTTSKNNFSAGTFFHYCRISNDHQYSVIRSKYHDFNEITDCNDNEIAKTFVKIFGCDFIYCNDIYYYFNNIYWIADHTGHYLRLKIANELSIFYLDEVKRRLKLINEMTDQTAIEIMKKKNESLLKLINNVQNSNINSNIQKMINLYIENNDIKWETNPYLFIFKNKIMDLKSSEFVEPCRDDYMCISTGYDYISPSKESIIKMNSLLDQVFPYPEERKLYLIILATALCGQTLEKFINANGNGGNGKGFLNELAQCVMGDYAYTCGNNVLLNPIKAGNNPEVANMNNKRVVFYREPDTSQNQKLNVATIKELTGGKEINARLNYSNNTKCNLKATHILECNERPKLSGKIDDAVVRRLIDIPFRATFTKNPEDYAGDYIFQGNDTVKTDSFQQEHKSALFNIIMEHWKLYLESNENIDAFIPSSVKERTKLYLEANDEIKEWFDTEYLTSDKDSYIQIKDIYERFCSSDLFQNLSKKERRENSKKAFTEKIIANINFKKHYKEEYRPYIDGKQVKIRQVLMGWKSIQKVEIEPEDDCDFSKD